MLSITKILLPYLIIQCFSFIETETLQSGICPRGISSSETIFSSTQDIHFFKIELLDTTTENTIWKMNQ